MCAIHGRRLFITNGDIFGDLIPEATRRLKTNQFLLTFRASNLAENLFISRLSMKQVSNYSEKSLPLDFGIFTFLDFY